LRRPGSAWPTESELTTVDVRGLTLWRRGLDGVWRVAMEHSG